MTAIGHEARGADDALAALAAGNVAQRELAAVVQRILALATADPTADSTAGATADVDGDPGADRGVAGLGGYSAAIAGLDVIETLDSQLEAARARLIAEAYARAHEQITDPDHAPGQVLEQPEGPAVQALSREQITGIDLATILHVSAGCAKGKVADAIRLTRHLPRTLQRLESGELTGFHVRKIHTAAAELTPEALTELDEHLSGRNLAGQQSGPGGHRASTQTVTRRIDAALHALRLEPATTRRRKAGFADRRVRFGLTDETGMTSLHGLLPALHATAIDTLLDDLARTAPDGDDRTHEQRRADAFLTLFTGPAALSPAAQPDPAVQAPSFDEDGHYTVVDQDQTTEAQQAWHAIQLLAAGLGLTFPDTPTATITIDLTLDDLITTHHGPDDTREPGDPANPGGPAGRRGPRDQGDGLPEAMLRGIGLIPAHVAARLCRDADLQRILTDPPSGQPLDIGRRHPSTRLRTAIQARDGTCRFPDCHRPASRADLDHIQPWRDDQPPEGQTIPANLQALCREHHRAKHQLHWTPQMHPDGTITWHNNLLAITVET